MGVGLEDGSDFNKIWKRTPKEKDHNQNQNNKDLVLSNRKKMKMHT